MLSGEPLTSTHENLLDLSECGVFCKPLSLRCVLGAERVIDMGIGKREKFLLHVAVSDAEGLLEGEFQVVLIESEESRTILNVLSAACSALR